MTDGRVVIEVTNNEAQLQVEESNVNILVNNNVTELEVLESNVIVSIENNPIELEIIETNVDVTVNETLVEVSIGTSGPQGPAGQADPTSLAYAHTQNVASQTWNIVHGLNFIPNITVVDSGGTVVEGSYNYPDSNSVVLSFSSAFSGKAYLS